MPRVSVIIPVYNGEAYLREAIDSVLGQSYEDFEVIVICEFASSAASVDILDEYQKSDPRVRLLQNSSRLGISASLNRGVREASGEYIARMDADDVAMPERLRKQVDFLDAHPDIDICGTDVMFIDEHGHDTRSRDGYPVLHEQIKSDLLFYCCLRHPTVMLRKKVFVDDNLWYNESYNSSEDYELWSRACVMVSFSNIGERLLKYRWYAGNATHRRDVQGTANYIAVMDSQFRRLGLIFTKEELELLCPITCRMSWRNQQETRNVLRSCAERIKTANSESNIYEHDSLKRTLDKRLYWIRNPFRLYAALSIRSVAKKASIKSLYSLANYLEWNGFMKTIRRAIHL